MALRPVTLRCPRCGNYLAAVPIPGGPSTWYACPHCAAPVPVVGERDPPPLFSWEVFPQVYPPLPTPRGASPKIAVVTLLALLAGALVLSGLAGYLGYEGASALSPGSFSVHGIVFGVSADGKSTVPLQGASLYLDGENGFVARTTTDASGRFAFPAVPPGGVNLTVSYPGYSAVVEELLLAHPFDTAAGGITVTMTPGGGADTATIVTTPFSTLESLVADLWSGASLFAITAILVAFGAEAAARRRRPALVAASGSAAAISPAVVYFLGLQVVYPDLVYLSSMLIGLGAMAAVLTAVPMARTGPAPDR
ncbi:MAG: carboxypeptidase-like regulatory domain-containing protein [Thermoplasmata archaeon]|nr:carboxypeptidase-like regulatory domain-containing protein [Thermoplasmata archaeon]